MSGWSNLNPSYIQVQGLKKKGSSTYIRWPNLEDSSAFIEIRGIIAHLQQFLKASHVPDVIVTNEANLGNFSSLISSVNAYIFIFFEGEMDLNMNDEIFDYISAGGSISKLHILATSTKSMLHHGEREILKNMKLQNAARTGEIPAPRAIWGIHDLYLEVLSISKKT